MRALAILSVFCLLVVAPLVHGEEQASDKSAGANTSYQDSSSQSATTKSTSTKTQSSKPDDPFVKRSTTAKRIEPQPSQFVRWLGASAKMDQQIDAKIRHQVTKIQFIDTPVDEVVGYLRQLHGFNIVLDQEAMKSHGLKVDMPITRNIEGLTLHSALNILCDENGLGWYVENEAIMVTSAKAANEHMTVRAYELEMMPGIEEVALAIPNAISPATWKAPDGASISQVPSWNVLLVRHNRIGHELIESLVELSHEEQ